MRLTSSLHVRQWLAKLHPPLPQTPRDSQQLLRMLEGSFRKHLDEVHPSPSQKQIPDVSHQDISLASTNSSSRAAQHYFSTILHNPLLSKSGENEIARTSLTAASAYAFGQAVSDGRVDIEGICRSAREYLAGVKKGENVAEKDRLADKLASWIYTASPSVKDAFFCDGDALRLAVQIVKVDRRGDLAWDWLRMLYERSLWSVDGASLQSAKWLSIEDVLVSLIMQWSIRTGDLKDATQQFVEACQYRMDSGRAAVRIEDVSGGLKYNPLDHGWKRLAAAIIHHRSSHGISEDLFNRATSYALEWSRAPSFGRPFIMVYHPTSPSASSLSQHLYDPGSAALFLQGQAQGSKWFRKTMLTVILDGAQLSLEQGSRKQAQFLLDFAHTHYAEFLPKMSRSAAPSLDIQIRNAQGDLKGHSFNTVWT